MNNGLPESELPEAFDGDEFRVLLVAEKYQTGFDKPLLQTMYVVKRLAGVQAVQTRSRLNRMAVGKARTFILDFANEEEDIFKAFKPYLATTPFGENADPQNQTNDRIASWNGQRSRRWTEAHFPPSGMKDVRITPPVTIGP